jgi:hypothetical protein
MERKAFSIIHYLAGLPFIFLTNTFPCICQFSFSAISVEDCFTSNNETNGIHCKKRLAIFLSQA